MPVVVVQHLDLVPSVDLNSSYIKKPLVSVVLVAGGEFSKTLMGHFTSMLTPGLCHTVKCNLRLIFMWTVLLCLPTHCIHEPIPLLFSTISVTLVMHTI